MVRNYLITGVVISVLLSCAQVGTISGGDRDINAPAPRKYNPSNKSTTFNQNQISITFDEYFKLVSPSQNIVIIPPHAQIITSVKKKTLTLSWQDTLQPNTTYSIYLNGAVADISEGNDSIYQYVFSTGEVLDSISYKTFISDARSNESIDNITLICYNSDGELVSMGRSQNSGEVSIQHLKPGAYSLIAVKDINNNLEIDPGEKIGFPEYSSIDLKESLVDSTSIKMFLPSPKPGIRSATFSSPGSLFIGATTDLIDPNIFIDEIEVPRELINALAPDSLILFPTNMTSGQHELVVKTDLYSDTLSFRVPRTIDSNIRLVSAYDKSGVPPSKKITYRANDRIIGLIKDSIRVFNKLDSSFISETQISYHLNEITIDFIRNDIRDVRVDFGKEAVQCASGLSYSWTDNVLLNELRSYGKLIIDHRSYESSLVIELIMGGRIARQILVSNPKEPTIVSELLPGTYTINVIVDKNNNGVWDTGSLDGLVQPEEIDRYSNPITVRANWDLEIPLEPNIN